MLDRPVPRLFFGGCAPGRVRAFFLVARDGAETTVRLILRQARTHRSGSPPLAVEGLADGNTVLPLSSMPGDNGRASDSIARVQPSTPSSSIAYCSAPTAPTCRALILCKVFPVSERFLRQLNYTLARFRVYEAPKTSKSPVRRRAETQDLGTTGFVLSAHIGPSPPLSSVPEPHCQS